MGFRRHERERKPNFEHGIVPDWQDRESRRCSLEDSSAYDRETWTHNTRKRLHCVHPLMKVEASKFFGPHWETNQKEPGLEANETQFQILYFDHVPSKDPSRMKDKIERRSIGTIRNANNSETADARMSRFSSDLEHATSGTRSK